MISKMTDVCVYVLNQESAFEFYTNKLGFKVKVDVPIGKCPLANRNTTRTAGIRNYIVPCCRW